MSVRLRDALMRELGALRHEPMLFESPLPWTYPAPLREAAEVAGRVCFFNEFVDIVVDGTRLERPRTPWSRR